MRAVASRTPLRELLRLYPREVLVGIGTSASTSVFNGMLFAYMPAYLVRALHYDIKTASLAQNVGLAVTSVGLVGVAWLGDRLSRRSLLLGLGAGLLVLLSVPFFRALIDRSVDAVALFVLAGLVASLINGTFAMVLADLFPTRVRFSGVAVSYNVSQTLFGGTVPLLAAVLVATTASPASPAVIVMVFSAITFIATLALGRYGGKMGRATRLAA